MGLGKVSFAAVLASLVFGAPAAQATFPGGNGKIVYVDAGNLTTMNPDGTGQVPLTSAGDADNPVWSPDGTKVAFDRSIGGNNRDIWVIGADGAGLTQLTSNAAADTVPSWSPDGTRIAFASTRDGNSEIYSMNPDGSDQVRLTNATAQDTYPDWAPDDSLIAFSGPGIQTMNPDGTDRQFVVIPETLGEDRPSWHPESSQFAYKAIACPPSSGSCIDQLYTANRDGTNYRVLTRNSTVLTNWGAPVWSPNGGQIVAQKRNCSSTSSCADWRIILMNADGSNQTEIAIGSAPDWQRTPLPPYVRPKGASPFATHFVPAYKACASPNRVHGAPLSFGSCAPPNPASLNVIAGTPDANGAAAKLLASATLKVLAGNPGTDADEADVAVSVSVSDIRCTASTEACTAGELSDYTGSMRLAIPISLTDSYVPNLPATSEGVVSIPVSCATTPDPSIGTACSTATTVDSVVPGAVREGNRAIWGLRPLELWDGGQDGSIVSRDDDTLFAVQGLFVP